MELNGKQYIYYVADFNHYEYLPADNAVDAIEAAKSRPAFKGEILTVCIATMQEIATYEASIAFRSMHTR